jgi:hypothetical protein
LTAHVSEFAVKLLIRSPSLVRVPDRHRDRATTFSTAASFVAPATPNRGTIGMGEPIEHLVCGQAEVDQAGRLDHFHRPEMGDTLRRLATSNTSLGQVLGP